MERKRLFRTCSVSLAWQNPDRFAHFRYNHDGRLVVPIVGNKAVPNHDPEVRLLNPDGVASSDVLLLLHYSPVLSDHLRGPAGQQHQPAAVYLLQILSSLPKVN